MKMFEIHKSSSCRTQNRPVFALVHFEIQILLKKTNYLKYFCHLTDEKMIFPPFLIKHHVGLQEEEGINSGIQKPLSRGNYIFSTQNLFSSGFFLFVALL